jgi:glycosyltransferase involved in cell wall biosynthesis
MKETLTHLPLERYRQRYSENLADWELSAFSKKFDVTTVTPGDPTLVMDIHTGSVLDSTARPVWAMKQVLELLHSPGVDLGKLYLSDFYHPGLDALAYSGRRFEASAFCWAQTFDIFDFTRSMVNWMRPWELTALNVYKKTFVASTGLADLIFASIPGLDANRLSVVGLPFNSEAVKGLWDIKEVPPEPIDCVYTSRWDKEKQPLLFLELVDRNPNLKFAVCTGWHDVRGTDTAALQRLAYMRTHAKNLTVYTGLTKGRYYAILSRSRVQLNTALQDWVSFTLLEALTFGCQPLYPNFRSFPEALDYETDFMYRPSDVADANKKLRYILDNNLSFPKRQVILDHHDRALDRIAEEI